MARAHSARRSLAHYISELLRRLEIAEPSAMARLRQAVGGHRARIALDDQVVLVAFAPNAELRIEPDDRSGVVDGSGSTDRATVLALLAGRVEVIDAILTGRLEVAGPAEAVSRIFIAIEIILDAAPRTPSLQALAREFVEDAYTAVGAT